MLKFLLTASPYLLKSSVLRPHKQMARSLAAYVLFVLSGLMFLIAVFIVVVTYYGAAAGFIVMGGICLFSALLMSIKVKKKPPANDEYISSIQSSDPLASLLPEGLIKDPAISSLIKKISENPIAATAAATGFAILVTRELTND